MRRLLWLLPALIAPTAGAAQTLPVVCNTAGTICTPATPIVNPDGTNITGGTVSPAKSIALVATVATTTTLGPFTPQLGREIWLTVSGTWTGSLQLVRSRDGGTTRLPLTYSDGTAKPNLTTNVNSIIGVETVSGATYYLIVTITTGTAAVRLEQ